MKVRTLDLETKGGGSFGILENVWCCSYATRDETGEITSGVLDFSKLRPEEIATSPLGQVLQQWILDDLAVFHNASFDVAILRGIGFEVPYYHDTLLMGYCVNPNITPIYESGHKPEKYSLWAWGKRLGKPKMEPPSFDEWTPELAKYAINDAVVTLHLYEYLKRVLQRDGQAWQHFMQIEMPYVEVIMEMQSTGLHIDVDKLEDLVILLQAKMDEIIQEMQEIVPIAPGDKKWLLKQHPDILGDKIGEWFYVGARERKKDGRTEYGYQQWSTFKPTADALTWALMEHYGWKPTEHTANGKPKTSKDVLQELDYPLALLKVEYNQVQTLLSSFGTAFLTKRDENDFIKCNWNQTVAKTGRLSSSSPNLQNIPANSELGQEFRKVITTIPGYKLVGIDLQAIEYRVLAALMYEYFLSTYGEVPSDVLFMVNVFQHDPNTPEGDIHTQMAKLWLADMFAQDWKRARKVGKNISYGRMFGFGAAKAGKMMQVTTDEARRLIKIANDSNPSFNEFRNAVWDEFREGGGIGHTFFGRRLVYPDICLLPRKQYQTLWNGRITCKAEDVGWRRARAERQAFNAKIQGTAADVIKMLGLEVLGQAWALGARLLAAVHDELLFLCPEETAPQLVTLLDKAFYKPHMLPAVPVLGNAQIGDNWFEVH